jgi:colicin import membrane protein
MKKGRKIVYTEKRFSLWLAAAAAVHVCLLFLLLYLQMWDSGWHIKPKIVSVSLVSLPGSGGSHDFSKEQGRPAEALSAPIQAKTPPAVVPKSESTPMPVVEKPVVKKPVAVELPKKISVEPLKPKINEKPSDINTALERLRQNVQKKTATLPQPSAGTLNKALATLQQKVTSAPQQAGTGSGGRNGTAKGTGGGGGTAAPYKAQIAAIIQQNWSFSKQLLKNSYGMSVYVRINIAADGTIRQIIFDKRAASEYLNNSVKNALEKSSPLPVLPKEEGSRDVWIGFVFTPEGIE